MKDTASRVRPSDFKIFNSIFNKTFPPTGWFLKKDGELKTFDVRETPDIKDDLTLKWEEFAAMVTFNDHRYHASWWGRSA